MKLTESGPVSESNGRVPRGSGGWKGGLDQEDLEGEPPLRLVVGLALVPHHAPLDLEICRSGRVVRRQSQETRELLRRKIAVANESRRDTGTRQPGNLLADDLGGPGAVIYLSALTRRSHGSDSLLFLSGIEEIVYHAGAIDLARARSHNRDHCLEAAATLPETLEDNLVAATRDPMERATFGPSPVGRGLLWPPRPGLLMRTSA
jgi:hypothetical protein